MGIYEGWTVQVAFARRLLALIKAEGPRDGGGTLVKPYRGWVVELERSVEAADAWDKGSQGKGATGG